MSTETFTVDKTPDDTVEIEIEKKDDDKIEAREPETVKIDANTEIKVDDGSTPVKEDEPNDPVTELKAQLETLNKAKAEAERERDEQRRAREQERLAREETETYAHGLQTEAHKSQFALARSHHQSVVNALAAEKAEAERAENELAKAHQEQDFAAIAKWQRVMAKAETRITQLEDGEVQLKAHIETLAKAPAPQPRKPGQVQNPTQGQRQPTGDAFEDSIREYDPRTQAYLRSKDKSWITDPKMRYRLASAHNAALAEDFIENSDAYFDKIDEVMGVRAKPEPKKDDPVIRQPAPQRKGSIAAPTSRGPETPQQAINRQIVKLTASELATVKTMTMPDPKNPRQRVPMTNAEFARRKYIMTENSKDPNYNGPRYDPT